MAKGKKICPQCNVEAGARLLKCKGCGYCWGVSKKETSQTETGIVAKSGKRGKKLCPHCNTEAAARKLVCDFCQHKFQKKEIVVVVEKEEFSSASIVVQEQEQVQRKTVVHENVSTTIKSHVLDTDSINIEQLGEIHIPSGVLNPNMTPKEHAERILGYGTAKAKEIYALYKLTKGWWGNVDWEAVREGLGLTDEDTVTDLLNVDEN